MKPPTCCCVLSINTSSPARGMWIETECKWRNGIHISSRPPRGGCGLKLDGCASDGEERAGRPPRGGCGLKRLDVHTALLPLRSSHARGMWIETVLAVLKTAASIRRPARGELGLKLFLSFLLLFYRRTVRFLVISIVARYSIFKRLASEGNTVFGFVAFYSYWLNSLMAFVV